MVSALPPDAQRDAARLFDLEMWLLGRDVRPPHGLLTRAGLTRLRSDRAEAGVSSAYAGALPGGGVLVLWAFGALCRPAACGGCAVFFPRDGFRPELVHACEAPTFHPRDLGPRRAPVASWEVAGARRAAGALARWLAGYEGWVAERLGDGYRAALVSDWRKSPPVASRQLAATWAELAPRLEAA